jgi:hypothetical protein
MSALNSVFDLIETMSSRNSNNRLIILLKEVKSIIIYNLCYYRILKQLVIIIKIFLKLKRHFSSLFARNIYIVDLY